ncbi:MAG: hypothetical protein ABIQ72_02805 [Usitatibacter sp.]
MTDSDDDLKRRYREISREEPSSALDAAILAKARDKLVSDTTFATTGNSRTAKVVSDTSLSLVSGPRFRRWSVPLSLAAVLMLGVGVSLRMQFERPGVETSMAASESAPPPPAASAPAAPAVMANQPAVKAIAEPTAPDMKEKKTQPMRAERKADVRPLPQPFAQDRAALAVPEKPAAPATITAPVVAAPAPSTAPPPPPAPKERADSAQRSDANYAPRPRQASEPAVLAAEKPSAATAGAASGLAASATGRMAAPSAPAPGMAPAAPAAAARAPEMSMAPQRAKREAEADAVSGTSDLSKQSLISAAHRELIRIARLREAGQNAEADKALEEFRKRFPDHRIGEAMWERVKPR